MIQPSGYRGPADPARDPTQVMSDGVAQNLIAQLVDLHEALCVKLDQDVHLAGMGPADPASGYVTGGGENDRMLNLGAAIRQSEHDRARTLKATHQRFRRDIQWYLDTIGVPCADPAHHHTPGETIDYLNGDGQRKVG